MHLVYDLQVAREDLRLDQLELVASEQKLQILAREAPQDVPRPAFTLLVILLAKRHLRAQ